MDGGGGGFTRDANAFQGRAALPTVPNDGDVWTYSAATNTWAPAPGGGGGGGAPTNATYITNTANATLTNELVLSASVIMRGTLAARPAANTVATGALYIATDTSAIYYGDGAAWNLITIAATTALSALTDVQLSGLAANDTLQYDGTKWVNNAPAAARTALGLVIGTNVEAWSARLDALAAIANTRGTMPVIGATDWQALLPTLAGSVPMFNGTDMTTEIMATDIDFTGATVSNNAAYASLMSATITAHQPFTLGDGVLVRAFGTYTNNTGGAITTSSYQLKVTGSLTGVPVQISLPSMSASASPRRWMLDVFVPVTILSTTVGAVGAIGSFMQTGAGGLQAGDNAAALSSIFMVSQPASAVGNNVANNLVFDFGVTLGTANANLSATGTAFSLTRIPKMAI